MFLEQKNTPQITMRKMARHHVYSKTSKYLYTYLTRVCLLTEAAVCFHVASDVLRESADENIIP